MEPEMEVEVEVEMSPAAAKAAVFSPYSSPSTALLLQRRVVSWYRVLELGILEPLGVLMVGLVVDLDWIGLQGQGDRFAGDGERPRRRQELQPAQG